MELVLGSCIGAALQVALFTLPTSVLVAWPFGVAMSFDFHSLETNSMLIVVLITAYALQVGWPVMNPPASPVSSAHKCGTF